MTVTVTTDTPVLDLVDPDRLDAVLRIGIAWLTASEQPDDALAQHHGTVAFAADGIRVRFAPAQPQGGPPDSAVVGIDAGYHPGSPSPGPRLLTDADCARFEAAIIAAGGNVAHSWNGAGCNSGSWAITGISPTLAAAVARYHARCPWHDTVFCGRSDRPDPCTWYRDGHARLVEPTFPPLPGDPDKPSIKDHYRLSPDTSRRIAATVIGLGILFFGAGILGVTVAFLVSAVVGYSVAEQVPAKLGRTVALALAVWSHGPVAGVESDRCYPARARHFLRYIATGENPRVAPKLPELGRWCAHCGAAEWCTSADGTVHAHDYQPADDEAAA